ncbi:helix-turn-helix domain-containing protein [Pseudonocardia cypriaca]|uniref:Helix-turn-helix protein n=1 Tax=Pseudonocardia cypriaca TaxID=882449 RepID=A0A543GDH8_9PSEU|nr:helix-turn-helix domain-containing protein [Pseudonocardia cypriaca]TQM44115.1 hypothetical protein FB388_1477 [Pseudonocardia cypriaca]
MAREPKLTIRKAAEYTGMPTSAIGHAAKLDPPRLRGYQTGPEGRWYFTKSDLDAWMASMVNTPAPKQRRRVAAGK